jgi:predicted ribosomally synthesized peptide with SipW-like signal peptide
MNTRILTSVLTIVAVVAAVSAMTYAYFSDTGTSNNNVFSAGTLNLALSDDTVETDQDNVTASFGGENMAPGSCTPEQELRLKNVGTVAADHIQIAVLNNVTDNPPVAGQALDRQLILSTFKYDYDGNGTNYQNISIPDSNSNGFPDLDDLEANGVDNLPLTNLGTDHPLRLSVCLSALAGNGVQGDSVDSDWTITLNQHASQ